MPGKQTFRSTEEAIQFLADEGAKTSDRAWETSCDLRAANYAMSVLLAFLEAKGILSHAEWSRVISIAADNLLAQPPPPAGTFSEQAETLFKQLNTRTAQTLREYAGKDYRPAPDLRVIQGGKTPESGGDT